jgi:hypothetical protein
MTELTNRPGQNELQYRIGTFATFREAMLREAAARPELAALTARQSDDFGVALVEMWAYLADILTLYQERYVQEAYLRTAVHRDSLTRLAALLAYRPRPGVAAETHVAFTVEAETPVALEPGIRIQSVPGPGEDPRKYETVEPVVARQALNRVRIYPQPAPANPFAQGAAGGILAPGPLPDGLRPGARLLLTSDSRFSALEKQVTTLTRDGSCTVLTFDPPMQDGWSFGSTHAYLLGRQFRLFGQNAPEKYIPADAQPTVTVTPATPNGDGTYSGPTISVKQPEPVVTDFSWSQSYIDLDGTYDGLKDGGLVLLMYDHPTQAGTTQTLPARITSVVAATGSVGATGGVTPYARTAVTRLRLDKTATLNIKRAVIYELGDPVAFWGQQYPDTLPAGASTCCIVPRELDPALAGADHAAAAVTAATLFEPGRTLLLTDGDGPPETVAVTAARLVPEGEPGAGHLAVSFSPALSRPLRSAAAFLYGNVARATHGESVKPEVLGSGDPAVANQSFTLKKAPVTFLQTGADAGSGLRSSLAIQVDGITWTEVDSFHGCGPTDRVYVTEVDGSGTVTVRFGDGTHGARLPRGSGNVLARYRQGSGAAGAVRPGTLTALLDRPRGLRGATNPGAALGGRDPEAESDLRKALPATVQTFGRAVSIRDFEALALSFPGVAKAKATAVWNGSRKALHLTVAGPGGAPVDKPALQRYLDARRDLNQALFLSDFTPRPVTAAIRFQAAPGYDGAAVEAAVRLALEAYFAFDARSFGEPIYRSDLIRAIQAVPGVAALAVDRLDFAGASGNRAVLPINPARPDPSRTGRVAPAELAVVRSPATDLVLVRRETL